MRRILKKLNYQDGYFVDVRGSSGGLAMLWGDEVNVEITSSSSHHIDCTVRGFYGDDLWRLTGFYGWSDSTQKYLSWELLRELKGMSELPWCVIGDFNQILYNVEKKGGPNRAERELADFREALDDCFLQDIGYVGEAFTWWNKQAIPNDVMERLDRVVASLEWFEFLFPDLMIHHLPREVSDHKPIKLARIPKNNENVKKQKKFRFEDMWLLSPDCEKVVCVAWDEGRLSGASTADVVQKIKRCSMALSRWNKEEFGNIPTKLRDTRKKIAEVDMMEPTCEVVQRRKELCTELNNLIHAEEIMWRQRSRICDLKEGDQSTKYFHMKASSRRRKNTIRSIHDDDGKLITEQQQIGNVATNFFGKLFTSVGPHSFDEALDGMETRIPGNMNSEFN